MLLAFFGSMLGGQAFAETKRKEQSAPVKVAEDYIADRKAVFDALPGWKFRCKVLGEEQTIEQFGGRIGFMKMMDSLLAECSRRFQVAGINDAGGNQIHFFMTEMVPFSGKSSPHMYDTSGEADPTYDIRLVVNDHSGPDDVAGGWLDVPYLALGHNYKGINTPYAVDALVHEFGHTRGVPDLYATRVDADKNPVNHQAYDSKTDVMNYPYGVHVWGAYSKMIIDASGGEKINKQHYEFFPEKVSVRVTDSTGAPVPGAKVNFYPVYPYSYSVTAVPDYKVTTDENGIYTFGRNPFIKKGSEKVDDNIFNFLVEVIRDGEKQYAWMPIDDAEVAGGKGENYRLEIIWQ